MQSQQLSINTAVFVSVPITVKYPRCIELRSSHPLHLLLQPSPLSTATLQLQPAERTHKHHRV